MFKFFPLKEKGFFAENDDELMKHIQKGDHNAFSNLVHRHSSKCYSIAYRFTGNVCDAEDVVQYAFFKIWQKPDLWQKKHNTKVSSWIYKIITNRCIDISRKRTPSGNLDLDRISSAGISCEEQLAINEKHRMLENAIANLPINQRTALNLCFYEDISNKDASEIMNLSTKAVQSQIMRAKKNLKEMLRNYHDSKK
ncbi:MAG: sigma-70 family RNA polymerase sigma factor [Desulfobacula sp.]|uniref:RNA polymerase sigma factor n=1 Tax=Desulfobacula sp. TaxID=2593537 RepID=UPI0025C1F3A2|nr:sigma-70 family RNA polymerase sigma factor [Desulfobacula sp.]MCD4722629.1 sigma-70 family RNA polymerase sigma factor [Desulfobacula sp.]